MITRTVPLVLVLALAAVAAQAAPSDKGAAKGDKVAVGASLGLTVATDTVSASIERNLAASSGVAKRIDTARFSQTMRLAVSSAAASESAPRALSRSSVERTAPR